VLHRALLVLEARVLLLLGAAEARHELRLVLVPVYLLVVLAVLAAVLRLLVLLGLVLVLLRRQGLVAVLLARRDLLFLLVGAERRVGELRLFALLVALVQPPLRLLPQPLPLLLYVLLLR